MKTLKDYQKYWQERSAKDEKDKTEQLKTLRKYAEKAAFHKRSDVDLAVEGMPAEKYFAAVGNVHDIFQGIKVDLVPMEDASPALLKRIKEKGVLLYGKI